MNFFWFLIFLFFLTVFVLSIRIRRKKISNFTKDNRVFAIEVDNFLLSRREVIKIIGGIPGAKIYQWPRFLSFVREEMFCRFALHDHKFEVWEPFGDNSAYWIGPVEAVKEPSIEILVIREAFDRYKPWLREFFRS